MNIEKMIATVQVYIHIRKGVEVDIDIKTPKDLLLLHQAYVIAEGWLSEKNAKITKLP